MKFSDRFIINNGIKRQDIYELLMGFMIKYRDLDYEKDIDEAITLIQQNLDPDYTKDFLLWKHYYNPFGQSISMVATENESIVAIVFYMRYNFQNNKGDTIRTIRPLDVCTDRAQRGKGLFKLLLDKCLKKDLEYDMLFSTPNEKSFPEFIKLGWSPLIKYNFKLGLINPYRRSPSKEIKDTPKDKPFHQNLNTHKYFCSAISLDFISWRFESEVYIIKEIFNQSGVSYLIYRIGQIKRLKCLILCDFIGDFELLNGGLLEVCKKEKLYLVYYLDNHLNNKVKFLFSLFLKPANIIYKEQRCAPNDDLMISLADLEGRL